MLRKISAHLENTFWKQVNATVAKFEKLNVVVRILAGLGLVILGLVGIILPVMPGFIFLVPGILLLFPGAKKWLHKK